MENGRCDRGDEKDQFFQLRMGGEQFVKRSGFIEIVGTSECGESRKVMLWETTRYT